MDANPLRLMQWRVLPQGVKNGPAIFQRVVEWVLQDVADVADPYFNDILIGMERLPGISDEQVSTTLSDQNVSDPRQRIAVIHCGRVECSLVNHPPPLPTFLRHAEARTRPRPTPGSIFWSVSQSLVRLRKASRLSPAMWIGRCFLGSVPGLSSI